MKLYCATARVSKSGSGFPVNPFVIIVVVSLTLVFGIGCYQGRPTSREPIHLNPNMDDQPKYEAMEKSRFFADGSAMRLPVEGTVARGELNVDPAYYTGKDRSSKLIRTIPVPVTMGLLRRGQERYNIYCSPCHGRVGDGQGIVVKRGYPPPPTFHAERLREIEDGHIFDVITNGIRNMPPYKHQVPVEDRWAIVAFFRALQRSQAATPDDIPADEREVIK